MKDFCYIQRSSHHNVGRDGAAMLRPIEQRGTGHDSALLLLHGFAATPATFRALLPSFTFYDAVVCPKLMGHGENLDAFSHVGPEEWLQSAEQAYIALSKDYQHVDIMGLSMGGLLTCDLMRRHTPRHAYLLAPALDLHLYLRLSITLAKVLRALGFRYLRNRGGNLHTPTHAELVYAMLPLSTLIRLLTYIKDFDLQPPPCSTDLFLGEYDAVVDSKRVAKRFVEMPNVRTHWLKQSAHVLTLDGDIDIIAACVNASNRYNDRDHKR